MKRHIHRVKRAVLGKALNPADSSVLHKISLVTFLAWVGLGADALSSSCYGPAEAFVTLGASMHLAIFVAIASAFTIFIISSSYSQIIELFPSGGGGYLVTSKLLSPYFGLLAGCALLIDYVLTITLSVAAGTEALFSFLPPELHVFKLTFALVGVLGLIILNLRGAKESVMSLVPIFLLFIVTHVLIVLYSFATHLTALPSFGGGVVIDITTVGSQVGFFGLIFLLMRSYSLGAGTYTGIEAVSNSVPILKDPKVYTAKQTMKWMSISLVFMVLGLMMSYVFYNVSLPEDKTKTLNAVLFEKATVGWGGFGYWFVLAALFSEAALLFVAAQTGFLGGPRVLAGMAMDRWAPARFATLSDRLVSLWGVLLMGGSAFALMLLSQGSVGFLLVLYSITVFITFSLSQLGMVRYWWGMRTKVKNYSKKMMVNGIGFLLTTGILMSMVYVKFTEGGWITILITGALVGIALAIKAHYLDVDRLVRKLDAVVAKAEAAEPEIPYVVRNTSEVRGYSPNARTAVVMVSGFNGVGIYTISDIFKSFGDDFKNYVFVEVGVVDAGIFKGADELGALKKKIKADSERYVNIMQRYGYHAEAVNLIGIDVVEEVTKAVPDIMNRFPNSVFFGGFIVLPKSRLSSRWLHNFTVYSLQNKLENQGITFTMVPINVK